MIVEVQCYGSDKRMFFVADEIKFNKMEKGYRKREKI